MLNKYPIIKENFHLHITARESNLYYIIKDKSSAPEHLGLKDFKHWKINPLMANYLTHCDGKTTHGDICKKLKVPFNFLLDKGAEYLMKETDVIFLSNSPKECTENLFITGNFNSYFPLHASIEITDYCNFRCKHCYVSSSPETLAKRSLEDTIKLMELLWDNGVKVIELTGGECTTHPDFKKIIEYASEKFNLIALISNGFIIGKNKELAKFISTFKNVAVQISLDGLEEYHDSFRNKKGAFEAATNAISYLKEYGTIVRVATTITPDNIHQLEDIFLLCKSLNADSFAVTTVSDFGRGKCRSCSKGKDDLKLKISETLVKYYDDPLFAANYYTLEAMKNNKEINCGAGWRTFAINGASGDVRTCLFLSNSAVIGNVDKDNYEDIFHKDKLDVFRNAPSPSPLLETCCNCEYNNICNGCMAIALETAKEHCPECPWAKKYGIEV